MEERSPSLCTRSRRQSRISRGRLGRPHELGEGVDIIVGVLSTNAARPVIAERIVGNVVAQCCDLTGIESVGDAHLIQIGATGEAKQTGILILPTEAADAEL